MPTLGAPELIILLVIAAIIGAIAYMASKLGSRSGNAGSKRSAPISQGIPHLPQPDRTVAPATTPTPSVQVPAPQPQIHAAPSAQPQTPQVATIFCARCGSQQISSANFCQKCGASLHESVSGQQTQGYGPEQAELIAAHEQAQALIQQGNFNDAVAIYDVAVLRAVGPARARARAGLAGTLVQMSEASRGTPGALSLFERNYVRIKGEIQNALIEDPSFWSIQAIAVGAAEGLAFTYTGPTGVTAWVVTSGGSSQMAKESEDSFKRLTNELLILCKLGQQTLERDGVVQSDDFVLAGEAALESMRKFDQSGQQAPVYVLDFFVTFPEDKIAHSGDPAQGSREVQNIKRLAEARRRR